jgi:hypothetical protein
MNSDQEHQSQQEQAQVLPSAVEQQPAAQTAKDDKIVRVTRNSSLRAQIGYAMKRVKSGD